jgi:hypothetical protein
MNACLGLPRRQLHNVGGASVDAKKGHTHVVGQVTGCQVVRRRESKWSIPLNSIMSSIGGLSSPRRRHARSEETAVSESLKDRQRTYCDAPDPLVVDKHLVIPVPLLTRRS